METVKIYNRLDNNIPHGSELYIVYDHFNKLYHVYGNIYDATFKKSFESKDQALKYYHKNKLN